MADGSEETPPSEGQAAIAEVLREVDRGKQPLPRAEEAIADANKYFEKARSDLVENIWDRKKELEGQEHKPLRHGKDSSAIRTAEHIINIADWRIQRSIELTPEQIQQIMGRLEGVRKLVANKINPDNLTAEAGLDKLTQTIEAHGGELKIVMDMQPRDFGKVELFYQNNSHNPTQGLVETLKQHITITPNGDFAMDTGTFNYQRAEGRSERHVMSISSPEKNRLRKSTPTAVRTAESLLKFYLASKSLT